MLIKVFCRVAGFCKSFELKLNQSLEYCGHKRPLSIRKVAKKVIPIKLQDARFLSTLTPQNIAE